MTAPTALTAREPLTVTELETLAALLNSASHHMGKALNNKNEYVWPGPAMDLSDIWKDLFGGFADLKWQAAETDPRAAAVSVTG